VAPTQHWPASTQALQSLAEELLYEGEGESEGAGAPTASTAAPARAAVTHSELRAALLDSDLRKLGAGCLPDDVNRANSSSIKGPLVLQVCVALCVRARVHHDRRVCRVEHAAPHINVINIAAPCCSSAPLPGDVCGRRQQAELCAQQRRRRRRRRAPAAAEAARRPQQLQGA
jgi:hypothetical protein